MIMTLGYMPVIPHVPVLEMNVHDDLTVCSV